MTRCVISILYGNRKLERIYRKRRKERTAQTRKTQSNMQMCTYTHRHILVCASTHTMHINKHVDRSSDLGREIKRLKFT